MAMLPKYRGGPQGDGKAPTVKDVRKSSAKDKATAARSYTKNGYKYTESAPGSNKFQNFTAKPTVRDVREKSASDKAAVAKPVVSTKAFPKGTADRQSTQPVRSKLELGYSPRDAAGVSKYGEYRASKDVQTKKYPSRQGGMDNAVPAARSEPTFPKGKGTAAQPTRMKYKRLSTDYIKNLMTNVFWMGKGTPR